MFWRSWLKCNLAERILRYILYSKLITYILFHWQCNMFFGPLAQLSWQDFFTLNILWFIKLLSYVANILPLWTSIQQLVNYFHSFNTSILLTIYHLPWLYSFPLSTTYNTDRSVVKRSRCNRQVLSSSSRK